MTCFECRHTENLHNHHVVARSLGGTKTVPLYERCHGLVHSKDFTDIGVLISKAMRQRLAEGRYIGGRSPYGLQNIDGHLVPCPAEQAVIAEARALRADGLTLRAVATELARRGHLSRHGTPFVPAAVNAMVAASRNCMQMEAAE